MYSQQQREDFSILVVSDFRQRYYYNYRIDPFGFTPLTLWNFVETISSGFKAHSAVEGTNQ
jgi:hypothetical protein